MTKMSTLRKNTTLKSVVAAATSTSYSFEEDTIGDKQIIESLLIDKLESDEITVTDLNSLKQAGFHTIDSLIMVPRKRLLAIKGLSKIKNEKILAVASKFIHVPFGFTTASELHLKCVDTFTRTTGSKELDKLLDGGIQRGSITEVFGESCTGKTQLCHTLAVTCQLPVSKGGGEGRCLYIDTQATFRTQRILSCCERYNILRGNDVLQNISVAKAYNTDHQTELLEKAKEMMIKSRYALLIVDSAISLYRTDYVGKGELENRQTHLATFLRKLLGIAQEFDVAVLITNQVIDFVDNVPGAVMKLKVPAGGNVMAQTRLSFNKGPCNTRTCKVYCSPCLPEKEAIFSINADGIGDAKE